MTDTKATLEKKPRRRGWLKLLFYVLLIVFVVIQFIQPSKNNQSMDNSADISRVVNVPADVHQILKTSCYDCHSNHTEYPWYSNLQPVGWWLADHIEEGKEHLNFSSFATLKPRPGGRFATTEALQDHKLEEIKEQLEQDEMPMTSYTIIHREASLSEAQKKLVYAWVDSARAQLEARAATAMRQP